MEKTITTTPVPKAFIYFRGALGDSILFLPVLAAFLKKFPKSEVTLAYPVEIFQVVLPLALPLDTLPGRGRNDLSRITLVHHSEARFRHFFDPDQGADWPPELTRFLAGFAHRLWVTNDSNRILLGKLKTLGLTGENFVHPPFPVLGESIRRHHEALIQKLIWQTGEDLPRIKQSSRPPTQEWDIGNDSEPKKVLLHPGSGSPLKNWPLNRYLELAKALAPHKVSFLFGPADEALLRECEVIWPSENIHSRLSLSEIAKLLGDHDAYVGNDSGVSHLAALLGVRTLVIALRRGAGFWDPLPRRVSVLWSDDLEREPGVSEAAFLVFKQGRD